MGTEFRTAAEVVSKYETKLKSGIVEIHNYELKSGNCSHSINVVNLDNTKIIHLTEIGM